MKEKIQLIKRSLFIKCLDCQNVVMNEDDNVCLCCGSKKTNRILINSPILKRTL